MKRSLLLLLLSLLSTTCSNDNGSSLDNPVAGRWSLVAQRDSTGNWNAFIPLVAVVIEFRKDGSVDYLDTQGQPTRECCQPTQYTFSRPGPCPPNAYCLQTAGTIHFTDWVVCPQAKCAFLQSWTTVAVDDTFLDIYAPPSVYSPIALRYQRIK